MAFDILDIHEQDQESKQNPRFYLQLAKYIAWISFIIGTIFLVTYLIVFHENILIFGLLYTLCAIAINTIVLLVLLWGLYRQKENRKIIAKRIALFLVNIPIAIVYFFIVIYCLDNVARLTIVNDTNNTINALTIYVEENNPILIANAIEKGASKTKYIIKSKNRLNRENEIKYINSKNETIILDIWGLSYGSAQTISINKLIDNQDIE